MNENLKILAKAFFSMYDDKEDIGSIALSDDIEELKNEIGKILPDWFYEIIGTYPFLESFIGIKNKNHSIDDIDQWIEISSVGEIIEETKELLPGSSIKKLGYFYIGKDVSSDEGIYVSTKEGDNMPVYVIEHDISTRARKILRKGRTKIFNDFSDIFVNGIIKE